VKAVENRYRIAFFTLLVVVIIGLLLTINFAYGDRPRFCANCHLMQWEYRTWASSVHQGVGCNDCHAPHEWPRKWWFKSKAGLGHIYRNTTGQFPAVLRATPQSQEVIQANCIRCHQGTLQKINTKQKCWNCHRGTPHGQMLERVKEG